MPDINPSTIVTAIRSATTEWVLANWFNAAALSACLGLFWKTYVKAKIDESVKSNYARALEGIKADLNTRLEVHKSELVTRIEEIKYTLKNAEFIFNKRLNALTSLRKYIRKMLPLPNTPDAEWDEAAEHIANNWQKILEWLEAFLGEFEAFLPREVSDKLNRAANIAAEIRFEFDWISERQDAEPASTAIRKAGELHDEFTAAVGLLQSNVDRNFRDVLP